MKTALPIIAILCAAALAEDEDLTRQIWNRQFQARRPATKAARTGKAASGPFDRLSYRSVAGGQISPQAGGSALLGVTLWRLRPRKNGEEHATTIPFNAIDLIPERIEADTPLAEGDKVRLMVEAPRRGYLYVIEREEYSDGGFNSPRLVYPNRQTPVGDNALAPGRAIEIPNRRERINVLTIHATKTSQIAEVLSLLVSPRPIEGIIIGVGDTGTSLDRDLYSQWESKWSVKPQRLELAGGAGTAWTEKEQQVGVDRASLLTRNDPPPQTLYFDTVNRSGPFLFQVRIGLKK